ncbi:diguanylate cyclase [Klebsiella pneumoniae]|nr:diguanylate cyclase [Klebsiella pneumoniae]
MVFFSTLLIWREINDLEEAYVANQRNNLSNVAHEMDGLLQFNIDRMMFFRHGMQAALEQPLDIDVLRKASQRYLSQRHQQAWRVALPNRRTLPVFGISGSVAGHNPILLVDDPLAADELMATLELGYLLNLTQHDRDFAERMQYISRSGFFTSTLPLRDESQVITHYSQALALRGLPARPNEIIRGEALSGKPFLTMTRSWKSRWSPLRYRWILPVTGAACWRWISQSVKSKRFWLAPCRGDKRESTNFMIAI